MNDLPTLYDGTLERTPDGGVIRFERHLPYPIGDVWDAVTNPARLAQWWVPFDADITVDLREGGDLVLAAVAGDPPPMTWTVLRVEPPNLFEHTHEQPGSFMRWELEGFETGCVLRLSHFVTDTTAAVENCYVVGLQTSLARLEPCLAGEPIAWDWEGFAEARAHYATVGLASAEGEQ